MSIQPLPILPSVGLGFLRLGDDQSQIRQYLIENEFGLSDSFDPYCLEVESSACMLQLYFDLSKRLVQIVVDSSSAVINGESLIGSTLDEALHLFGARSFTDTLWSNVDIEMEYSHGVPLANEKRSTKCDQKILLDGGTLWIKSMGIGLNMVYGEIESIAIRKPDNVPQIGCGPLNKEAIVAAGEVDLKEKLDAQRAKRNDSSRSLKQLKSVVQKLVFYGLAIGLLIAPAYFMYSRHQAWKNATQVEGTIVETKMDGPFLVGLIVEYPLPDARQVRVEVNPNYITSREVGQTTELVYLEEAPEKAITPREARDAFLSGYLPYLAILSPILAIALLAWRKN